MSPGLRPTRRLTGGNFPPINSICASVSPPVDSDRRRPEVRRSLTPPRPLGPLGPGLPPGSGPKPGTRLPPGPGLRRPPRLPPCHGPHRPMGLPRRRRPLPVPGPRHVRRPGRPPGLGPGPPPDFTTHGVIVSHGDPPSTTGVPRWPEPTAVSGTHTKTDRETVTVRPDGTTVGHSPSPTSRPDYTAPASVMLLAQRRPLGSVTTPSKNISHPTNAGRIVCVG